jgi:hypothetical protein
VAADSSLEFPEAFVRDVPGNDAHELAERVVRELHQGRALVGPAELLEKVLQGLGNCEVRDLAENREHEQDHADVLAHMLGVLGGAFVPQLGVHVAGDGRRQLGREHRGWR